MRENKREVKKKGFRHWRLVLLAIIIVITYFVFSNPTINGAIHNLGSDSYLGYFLAGLLLPLGFTAPFAVGFFITLNPTNPLVVALIGGAGAMVSNILIFHFIRLSFKKEFEDIEKTKPMRELIHLIKHNIGHRIRVYLLYLFIGFVFASPLPDEIADVLVAGLTHVKARVLAPIMFVLGSVGIYLMVSI